MAWHATITLLRTRFFWVWNGCGVLLALSLNHITFFDFMDGGKTTAELFLSTMTLFGAVSALAFYIADSRETALGQWSLLVTRPVSCFSLVAGRWLGLTMIQLATFLLLAGAYCLDSHHLGRSLPAGFWTAFSLTAIKLQMLSGLYSFLAIAFRQFWALTFMVIAYILGHLSDPILEALPAQCKIIGTALFCFIPDLGAYSELRTDLPVAAGSDPMVLWMFLYSVSYVFIMLYTSTLPLEPRRSTCRGTQRP